MEKECFVYVIESITQKNRYTGLSFNIEERLVQYNKGYSAFTKSCIPWELVYYEKMANRSEARKREKYLKSAAGRRFVEK